MSTTDKKVNDEPMLVKDQKESPVVVSTFATIWDITSYATWPMLGMVFHPLYMVINSAVVGRMETKYLAGLGLGSLTTGIFLISLNVCFALVVSSFVAPAHGVGDNRLARMYLHR